MRSLYPGFESDMEDTYGYNYGILRCLLQETSIALCMAFAYCSLDARIGLSGH